MTSDRQVRYGQARPALIRAAMRLVGRDGLSALSYRTLAAEAGITHGAIRYHFESLDAIIVAALEESYAFSLETVRPPQHPSEYLTHFVPALSSIEGTDDLTAFQAELTLESRRRPELRALVDQLNARYTQWVREDLRHMGLAADDEHVDLVLTVVDGIVFQYVAKGPAGLQHAQQQIATLQKLLQTEYFRNDDA